MDDWLTAPLSEEDVEALNRRKFLLAAAALGAMPWLQRARTLADMEVRTDREMVDELALITRELAERWAETSPTTWVGLLKGHHAVVGTLALDATPMYRAELQRLAGRAALLSGLADRLVGRDDRAQDALTAAELWAIECQDARLRAIVQVWRSDIDSHVQRGLDGPSPPAVLDRLAAAVDLLDPLAPAPLWSQVLRRQAEELTAAGRAGEAMHALERADRAWLSGGGHEEGLFGIPWPPAMNDAFAGNVLLLAGEAREAVVVLHGVLDAYPLAASSNRIAAMTDLAAAMIRTGELEHGCSLLGTAGEQAVGIGLADRVARVRGVRQRELSAWGEEPAVRRLDERLAVGA